MIPLPLTVLSDLNSMFQSLLFGEGSLFGLIIIIAIVLPLCLKWKEACVVFLPVTVILGYEYFVNSGTSGYSQFLPWYSLVMFFVAIFIVFIAAKHKG